jgi:hypothetical protein
MQSTIDNGPADEVWHELSPLLDEAMNRLGQTERDALLLRYFENRSLREVGSALGTNEECARKRVARGLEKLHAFFAKRGVSSTTAIIAGAISAHSAQAVPAALAKTVTAAAVAKGASAGGSTLTLIKGALKLMAWTKAKTVIVAGIAAVVTLGTTTIAVFHNREPADIYSRTQELSSDLEAQYEQTTGMRPEQVAKAFFEGCGRKDWAEVARFDPNPFDDRIKNIYGGLQVVSLGKPFWGWERNGRKYGGVFVPYEVRLQNGEVSKWRLAIQYDNSKKSWYIDGGTP